MESSITIVLRKADYKKLCDHLFSTKTKESMAIAFYSLSQSLKRTKLLVKGVKIPSEQDYLNRTACYVALCAEFMEQCFCQSEESETNIMDIHTHPWSNSPEFSPIDDSEALQTKIPYLNEWFPDKRIAFVLFGSGARSIKARVWNEESASYDTVDHIHII